MLLFSIRQNLLNIVCDQIQIYYLGTLIPEEKQNSTFPSIHFFLLIRLLRAKKINNTDDMDIFKLPQGFWTVSWHYSLNISVNTLSHKNTTL